MADRANYLPAPAFFELNHACKIIAEAFGTFPYLVGSCLEHRGYRDVDIRLILEDEHYSHLFPGLNGNPTLHPLWSLLCASIALWLQQRSGLPVDFQIQQQTEANEHSEGKHRHALGIFLTYPGGG
jgi:hypothetical protein